MSKSKLIIIATLIFGIYLFLVLWTWGWICAIILIILLVFTLFSSMGGSIITSYNNFLTKLMIVKRKEKAFENSFVPEAKAKIAIGLSGGVDSAVAALLLKQQGYEVEAFFMRNWDSTINNEWNKILTEEEICQQELDYEDAKKVANQLEIKLTRIDFVKEYWDLVFKRFLSEIKLGITPNPDIFCNKYIKFDKFVNYIFKQFPDFSYVATGHYARIVKENDEFFLGEAVDINKDQTYFLAEINKKILQKIYFPLWNLTKSEVRTIAKDNNLAVANKKDSTGICFIGERNFPDFIKNYLQQKPGKIIDEDSKVVVGNHVGVWFYTIGQRRGLSLNGFEQPYFVSDKDVKKNILYVSSGDKNKRLYHHKITAKNFNFLAPIDLINGEVEIKTRHSEIKYLAVIKEISNKQITIESKTPIKFVTPGQELVIYKNGICLGGGQIENKK